MASPRGATVARTVAWATRRWPRPTASDLGVLYAVLLLVVAALVLVPLVVLVLASLKPSNALPWDATPFVLDNLRTVFASSITYTLLGNTFAYVAGSLLLGLTLGLALAWLAERTDLPGRGFLFAALTVALGLPPMLTALGWTLWLSPRVGVANLALRQLLGSDAAEGPLNGYSLGGMMFVTGLAIVPSVFMMLSALLRGMDASIEEAAEVSGASTSTVWRRVTLPLLLPGLLAVVMYYTVVLVEHFDIPLALGLPGRTLVLSTRVFMLTQPDNGLPEYGLASAYALIALALGLVLIFAYLHATRRAEQYRMITGRGYRPRRLRLGRARYPALALVGIYLLVGLAAPLAMLLWVSLLPVYQPPSLEALGSVSLAAYVGVLGSARLGGVVANTLLLMVATATLAMLLSILVAWVSLRARVRGGRLLEGLAFAALALPSVVIALAVLLVYLRSPIYGTVWIIVVGQVTAYLAFGTRTMAAAVLQLDRELEEAAAVHGAAWWTTLRRVVAPLLLPALVNGWVWVAAHSIRDFTFPLMLATSGNMVLAGLIWNYWRQPNPAAAAALSIMLALALGLLAALGRAYLASREGARP